MTDNVAFATLVSAAAQALRDRVDEVNKLNVFPVPDGDTGTNMSLTMDAVIEELRELPADASAAAVCKAVTHGSLMGARGNSGVILSQILRGLCDEIAQSTAFDQEAIAKSLERAKEVAYQAVRKPVEGTMLTVVKDAALAARAAVKANDGLDATLDRTMSAIVESVKHTPDLLPILKQNGVVDAGGYGLAILAEGLLAAYEGHEVRLAEIATSAASLQIVPVDDWNDQEFLYCTEFLLLGDGLDRDAIATYVSGQGGSELVVGDASTLKIHVHTNDPGAVLAHMTGVGEIAQVHVNNMRRQTADRTAMLQDDLSAISVKPYGLVTVAVGEGLKEILGSLGADVVVNGGQTMNPSTAELLDAVRSIRAKQAIILPNNRNIVMAAQQAAEHAEIPVGVVPTGSVPEAFAALLSFDAESPLEDNVVAMTEAASLVRTAEVTTAIKDSHGKAGDIRAGQIIGIADHEIEVIGDDVVDVAGRLLDLLVQPGDAVTLLAGEDLSDAELAQIESRLGEAHPDVDIESHRGGQPLYPLILSVE